MIGRSTGARRADSSASDESRRFAQERAWAELLRTASAADRPRLYAEINDAWVRQIARPEDLVDDSASLELQRRLLGPLVGDESVVVEIGAGSCGLARRLAPQVAKYLAIEASAERTRQVRLPANAELIVTPGPAYPVPDATADLVYSCHVVEHLHPDDVSHLARESLRMLRPGGRLLWVTPNRLLGPHDVSAGFTRSAQGLHLVEYSHCELADLICMAGFEELRAVTGLTGQPRLRRLRLYRWLEPWLERCPRRLRELLLSAGRTTPLRRFEQVVLSALRPPHPRRLEPFLHVTGQCITNPLTGTELRRGDPLWRQVKRLHALPEEAERVVPEERLRLEQGGWLVDATRDEGTRYRLRFVSLETTSVCNQHCNFCPVSVAPRQAEIMSAELFERIAVQLVPHAATLEAVFLHNYNEPTADPHLVDRVRFLRDCGLPAAFNTNASLLDGKLVDALVEAGGLGFVSVNLSTVDAARYRAERGADHLSRVLANLDAIAGKELADRLEVAVLGDGGAEHQRTTEAVRQRLAATRFAVKPFMINHRAGALERGHRPAHEHRVLRGCDNLGSRPLEHLHVTASGTCVLCCQDYHERHRLGELRTMTVEEVLNGEAARRLRRMIYGLEVAPQDLLCRRCIYALS